MNNQYLMLVCGFAFMAAFRLTISFNLRAVLQMLLFAVPLSTLLSAGDEGITGWAYVCLGLAVAWWFADLYVIFRSARMAYHGRKRYAQPHPRPAAAPQAKSPANTATSPAKEPEKVSMVSLKADDIQFGPVIGQLESKPIYEWLVAAGREGRADYVGILGRGAQLEDEDLLLPPGLVYRWKTSSVSVVPKPVLETV